MSNCPAKHVITRTNLKKLQFILYKDLYNMKLPNNQAN